MSKWKLLSFGMSVLFAMQPLQAQSVQCGTYASTANDGTPVLTIDSATTGSLDYGDKMPHPLLLEAGTSKLAIFDIENGVAIPYAIAGNELKPDGTMLDGYRLRQAHACRPAPPRPAKACSNDVQACSDRVSASNDPAELRAICNEGLPFACKAYIDALRRSGNRPAIPPEPEVCKHESPQFNATACKAEADKAMAQVLSKQFSALFAAKSALDDASLDGLPALCRDHPQRVTCNAIADELWSGGRLLAARDALAIACRDGNDADACKHADALSSLTAANATLRLAQAVPCGGYTSANNSMFSEFNFGDAGLVDLGGMGSMRARLVDGRIHVRHDKGGDFVFAVLADGRLAGLDEWTRYAVLAPTGGPAQCTPARTFREVPLAMDCPAFTAEAAKSCCDEGKLQGCNTLGNTSALGGNWAGALPHYRKVCAAGIREGCENLAQAAIQGNLPQGRADLETLCKADARHVACDVLETTNWAMMGFAQAMEQAAQDATDKPRVAPKKKKGKH